MLTKENQKRLFNDLPDAPGVYRMLDQKGQVIYIGKAKSLKKRVKQYFKTGYEHSSRTRKLLEKVDSIEYTAVDSDLEARILETNQIKQFQPKYNVIMKDDKNYVYIKITKNEDYPRIQIVRQVEKDGAKYIGPKSAAHKVRETFKVLKKIFPFRHCGLDIELIKENPEGDDQVKVTRKVIKYPCIDYYIKRCAAPCIGKISKEEYAQIIKNIEDFLNGHADDILKDLEAQMKQHAINHKFEKAAKVRDKIEKVRDILEHQKVSDPNRKDTDVINYCISHDKAYFNLFQIRDGKLIGQENFVLSAKDQDNDQDPEILEAFIKQYYEIATDIPAEILLPHEIEDNSLAPAKVLIPQRGDKNKLLEMSLNNARIHADRNKTSWQEESELTIEATKALQKELKLKSPLNRIECYDISHLSGTDTVGSMIVFEKGAPKKQMYRKFKLRTVQNKPDDYKSMEEVLTRRFNKLSTQLRQKDYKFKKIRKSDFEFVRAHNNADPESSDAQFYILEHNKKTVGFISLKEYNTKVAELRNLWLSPDLRGQRLGYKLISEAIKKTKTKRIYIICRERLKDYYQLFGFEEIKKRPEELEEHWKKCAKTHTDNISMAIDRIKLKEDESFTKIPDLIIIDGGKGQLSAATKVFKKLEIKIPYISLAKRLEEVFIPNQPQSIVLERNSEALKLLQRARDEAHRFAISYNRNLRSKRIKSKK